ncbi:MAG TPA: PIN domain-containing protein [Thermoanaerobaculia bacterium]|jgi:predicted nucleic acid-binding protein|nr:PIN domain-containing protein [Thermoanaerobaculia bacterium]
MRSCGVEPLLPGYFGLQQLQKGDTQAVDLIDRAEWLGLSTIALGELWIGFQGGTRREKNEAELDEFLSSPQVEELVIDRETGRIYAEMIVSLQRAGTPVPSNDVWIAAAAVRAGVPVITYDRHFADIRQARSIIFSPPSKKP